MTKNRFDGIPTHAAPPRDPPDCDHGVQFPLTPEGESAVLRHMSAHEVRACFPRLFGPCPKKCGFSGIAYASRAHYVAGDW